MKAMGDEGIDPLPPRVERLPDGRCYRVYSSGRRSPCSTSRDVAMSCASLTDIGPGGHEAAAIFDWGVWICRSLSFFHGRDLLQCAQASPELYRQFKGMEQADFSGCSLNSDSVSQLARRCRNWRHVSFSGCKKLRDAAIGELARQCEGLQEVDFSWCSFLTDSAVGELARHAPELQRVALSGCDRLTDEAARQLARHCAGLERVAFGGCRNFTVGAVRELAERCAGLKDADFRGCERLGDGAATELARHCASLERVGFDQCKGITAAAVRELARACPSLRMVGVAGTSVGHEALAQLQAEFPQLELTYA